MRAVQFSREEPMAHEIQIMPASAELLPDILDLEQACFSAPWTRKMLEAELTGNQFAHFLVAVNLQETRVSSGSVAGYHCFWIVFEELRLMNLAVHASLRRQGIGRALATEAIRIGVGQGATKAVLEVRASNKPARNLYQRMGFTEVGTRFKYYSTPVEDAVVMEMNPLVLREAARHDHESIIGGGAVSAS